MWSITFLLSTRNSWASLTHCPTITFLKQVTFWTSQCLQQLCLTPPHLHTQNILSLCGMMSWINCCFGNAIMWMTRRLGNAIVLFQANAQKQLQCYNWRPDRTPQCWTHFTGTVGHKVYNSGSNSPNLLTKSHENEGPHQHDEGLQGVCVNHSCKAT